MNQKNRKLFFARRLREENLIQKKTVVKVKENSTN